MKLSKAQKEVVEKLRNKSTLYSMAPTWFPENVFFRNSNDSYERSNVKVLRKLVQKNILLEKKTEHFLVREYTLNEHALAALQEQV